MNTVPWLVELLLKYSEYCESIKDFALSAMTDENEKNAFKLLVEMKEKCFIKEADKIVEKILTKPEI